MADDFILAVKFSYNGTKYEIFADRDELESAAEIKTFIDLADFSPTSYVLKDGKELDSYPETWAGTKLTDEDFLMDIISKFNLNVENLEIEYVHDALNALSEKFCGHETFEGTDIPTHILHRQYGSLKAFALDFLSESKDGKTAVYCCVDDEGIVMLDPDTGRIMTDMEDFAISGTVRSVLDGEKIMFVSEGFGRWLGECLEPKTPEEEQRTAAFMAMLPQEQPEAVM